MLLLFRKHNHRWAFDEAVANVEKFFTVIGILEDLETTLTVLEEKVPEFFTGVTDLHASRPGKFTEPFDLTVFREDSFCFQILSSTKAKTENKTFPMMSKKLLGKT